MRTQHDPVKKKISDQNTCVYPVQRAILSRVSKFIPLPATSI